MKPFRIRARKFCSPTFILKQFCSTPLHHFLSFFSSLLSLLAAWLPLKSLLQERTKPWAPFSRQSTCSEKITLEKCLWTIIFLFIMLLKCLNHRKRHLLFPVILTNQQLPTLTHIFGCMNVLLHKWWDILCVCWLCCLRVKQMSWRSAN